MAEGTKQIRPASGDFGYIQINDRSRTFATYIATPDERLNIHISNSREKIYYGFGRMFNGATTHTDVWYRIRKPDGTIVFGPTQVPSTGTGFISTHAQAVAGPRKLNASGYTHLVFAPTDTGDYYIEFNQGSASTIVNPNPNKRIFENFDITVIDTVSNTAKNGRVWSKNWDLTTNGNTNGFIGTFFVYSNDGVVTSVNFNGIQPHGFTLSCNTTGCVNTGNLAADRKSRNGSATYADYKLFLNDPDVTVYPNGVIGTLQTSLTLTGCAPNYCLNVTTDAPGFMEFVINLNGIPGYQAGTRDLIFGQPVSIGTTCIPWDGKDGLGNTINQSINFEVLAEYKFGLTNLPIFDVENFSGGFIVSSIRPLVIKPKLFWDDSDLPGGTTNLTGCVSLACHPWPSANFGNDRTINTWWYVNVQRDTIISQTIPRPNPNIVGTSQFCDLSSPQTLSTTAQPGHNYLWRSTKNSITSTSNTASINFVPTYGIDTITVLESNAIGCYEDSIFVQSYPIPNPILTGDSSACDINTVDIYRSSCASLNTLGWTVTGGSILSGQGTGEILVQWTQTGNQQIKVIETNPNGCNMERTLNVIVHPKPSTLGIQH